MKPGLKWALLTAALLAVAVVGWRAMTPADEPVLTEPTPEPPPLPQSEAAPFAPLPPAVAIVPRQTVQSAVVESGIAVRLVRRPRLGLPPGRFAETYARLLPEAESGNALSQFRLGNLLFECRDVPASADALEAEIEAIHQTRHRGRWEIDSPKAEIATLRHQFAQCDGIPAEARLGFRDWLKKSADAGVIEAQINLPMRLPAEDYCQYLAECTPDLRARQEALQAEALDYTTRARDAGSVAALWTMAGWYAGGEVLPQNDIEAYAHFRALDQIHGAAKLTPRFDKLLAGMKKRLRPVDIDAGEARARELLSNPRCCVITP